MAKTTTKVNLLRLIQNTPYKHVAEGIKVQDNVSLLNNLKLLIATSDLSDYQHSYIPYVCIMQGSWVVDFLMV